MPALQKLLFADPRPLVERLGRDFFRRLPQSPGVYLMRDTAGTVLYVGKARNLRKRLASYRVANPDRHPRRHLRLLRAVARIETEESADERAALAREAQLLRALRPRFNRAGTWPAPPKFLGFRVTNEGLQLAIFSTPVTDCRLHGPHGPGARHLRNAIARLLWVALYPARGVSQLPVGWFRGRSDDALTIRFAAQEPASLAEASAQLDVLFADKPDGFAEWIRGKVTPGIPPFEKAALEGDLEFVNECFGGQSVPGT
jgi:predicted GIY-YIG superfamily endonuclease